MVCTHAPHKLNLRLLLYVANRFKYINLCMSMGNIFLKVHEDLDERYLRRNQLIGKDNKR